MEQKPNNVIPFPGPKKKKKDDQNRKPTLFFDFENRKVMISASLGSILLLMALVNTTLKTSLSDQEQYALHQMNSQSIDRIPAKIKEPVSIEQLQRRIASVDKDEPVAIGRKPNALEELRFGQLSGNYALKYTNGKKRHTKYVQSIEFVQSNDTLPSYLNDREKFLWKNRDLLPVQFDTVKLSPPEMINGKRVESYKLLKGKEPVGHARFQMDKFGRFISMKVQKNR